jgi:hypothetical protein
MKVTVSIVVKSTDGCESYYIDMALKSVIPYVHGIYVQDQDSNDDLVDVVKRTVGDKVPLTIETVHNPLPRFDPGYKEADYRGNAIFRCEEIYKPDWFITMDADEIFTPKFFEILYGLEKSGELSNYNGIGHATERFVTPKYKSCAKADLRTMGGYLMHDPHIRSWRGGVGITQVQRSPTQFIHVVERPSPKPFYTCYNEIIHIHLHRSFGPKAFEFWREGGDIFEETVPFYPMKQAPKYWFKNMAEVEWVEYEFPDYVLEKWLKWGCYDRDPDAMD